MSGGKKCNFWPCYSFYVETLCKTTEEICSAYNEGFIRQLFPFQIGNIFFCCLAAFRLLWKASRSRNAVFYHLIYEHSQAELKVACCDLDNEIQLVSSTWPFLRKKKIKNRNEEESRPILYWQWRFIKLSVTHCSHKNLIIMIWIALA